MSGGREPAVVAVRFLRFPLRVDARAQEYYRDVFREFALMAAAEPAESDTVPSRLSALVEALGRRYEPQSEHEAERERAFAAGEVEGELSIKVPRSAAEASSALDGMLDEADEFCRAGDLLTLAAPPDVAAFRRWYLHEVIAQVEGAAATPWPGALG